MKKNQTQRTQYCWFFGILLLMAEIRLTTWDVSKPVNNGISYLSTGAGLLPSTVVTFKKLPSLPFPASLPPKKKWTAALNPGYGFSPKKSWPVVPPSVQPPHSFNIWLVVSNIFYFHPYLGKIPILTNIFQRGWFNHQLDIHFVTWTNGFSCCFFQNFSSHNTSTFQRGCLHLKTLRKNW